MNSEIQVNSAGQFIVNGELNFQTVPECYRRGCQLISASPKPIFDLKMITNCDNAASALLVAWTRYAKHMNKAVRFVNIPNQLFGIIEVTGLKNILPIF